MTEWYVQPAAIMANTLRVLNNARRKQRETRGGRMKSNVIPIRKLPPKPQCPMAMPCLDALPTCPSCKALPEWLRLEMAAAEEDRLELLRIKAEVERATPTGSVDK